VGAAGGAARPARAAMKKQPHVPAVARIMVQATRSSDREALLPTMSGFKSPVARDCTTRAPWAGTVLTLLALQLGFGLWLMPAAFSRCAPRARRPPPDLLARGAESRTAGPSLVLWPAARLKGGRCAGAGWGGCPARRPS